MTKKIQIRMTNQYATRAFIEWELENGNFSASGRLYNRNNCFSAGQNLDEISDLAPNDERVQRIVAVWREYHLNDLTAGSPRQMAYIKEFKRLNPDFNYDYTLMCSELEKVNLLTDTEYMHNGKPYIYGHAWLKTELPQNIVDEINSWDAWLES